MNPVTKKKRKLYVARIYSWLVLCYYSLDYVGLDLVSAGYSYYHGLTSNITWLYQTYTKCVQPYHFQVFIFMMIPIIVRIVD